MSGRKEDNVQVVVRCRPLFGKELKEGRERIVDMDVARGEVSLRNPKVPNDERKKFTFDRIFDWNCTQREVYEGAASGIVDASIQGFNGTIFCYGQTGTGKTHTMEGKDEPASERGILPHTFHHVFDAIDGAAAGVNYLVRASFLEIYNENVRDLLAKDQSKTCDLKENPDTGVYVKDLTTFVVKSVAEINNVLQVGKKNRSVGATLMNADSSRSHSIFTVTIETSQPRPGDPPGAAPHITVGKLNLVDLAGSERQSKTQATGDRLKEATKINLSLSTLGNVISALVDGKSSHIPYRDSKLTRLLQDSLGGNTKTVMIANLGPADYNFDETMSTLRYANRAKNIKNKPKINEDPKDAMLREFQEEIARLKAQLGAGGSAPDGAPRRRRADRQVVERTVYSSDARLERIKDEMRREMEANAAQDMEAEEAEKAQALVNLKARKQMKVLMEEKERTEEERAELEDAFRAQQAEAQAQFEEMRREKDEQRALEEKLAAMQAKVVRGGTNLLDQEQRLLEEARRREEKLAKIAAAEAEQARRIKELEDLNTVTGDKYKTIEEEIESKSRKTRKLHEAYQRCVVDLKDLDLEFERERENLLDTVRALTRQIKLKNLVLDSYVPPDELRKMTEFASWDDRSETWRVDRAQHAGNPARARRLAADAKRVAEGGVVNERLVAALADAYGDFEKAREAAGKSDSARLQSAYYAYGGSSSSASAAEHGEGADGVPSGKYAKASRPGSARGGKRTRPASAAARRGRDGAVGAPLRSREPEAPETDESSFPAARGLVR